MPNRLEFSFYSKPTMYWVHGLVGVLIAITAGFIISTWGLPAAAATVLVPLSLISLIGVLLAPKLGLFLYVQLSFLIPLLIHFLPIEAPLGTLNEVILIVTMLGVIINGKHMQWHRLRNPAFYLLLLWVVFTCLEFFNPETPNRVPSWIYRFRSFSFWWLFTAIIVSVVPISRRDIKIFIGTWLIWSLVAALWAFKQQYLGLTPGEVAWIRDYGGRTHLLFGFLRSFSFYSDASQLGAEMAGATLVCVIFSMELKRWIWRILFFTLSGIFFWGYAVTGTRSALFVFIAGFAYYLVAKRSIIKLAIGGSAAMLVLSFLLFTNIGNGNYQIYRMRTALHPSDDPSFVLRLENQQRLATLLAPLPFGVGLGTSSSLGDEFNPGHWAGQIPPDSWYVLIWIETGVVGLSIYLMMLLVLIGISTYKVWHIKDPGLQIGLIALLAEFVGIACMAYSNAVMGQLPTCSLFFISTFLFTTADRWNDQPKTPKQVNTSGHYLLN